MTASAQIQKLAAQLVNRGEIVYDVHTAQAVIDYVGKEYGLKVVPFTSDDGQNFLYVLPF